MKCEKSPINPTFAKKVITGKRSQIQVFLRFSAKWLVLSLKYLRQHCRSCNYLQELSLYFSPQSHRSGDTTIKKVEKSVSFVIMHRLKRNLAHSTYVITRPIQLLQCSAVIWHGSLLLGWRNRMSSAALIRPSPAVSTC